MKCKLYYKNRCRLLETHVLQLMSDVPKYEESRDEAFREWMNLIDKLSMDFRRPWYRRLLFK